MPGAIWTNQDQETFLTERFAEYRTYMPKKKYAKFWCRILYDWFIRFPEIEELFPGKQESDLTPDECQALAKAQKIRVDVHFRKLQIAGSLIDSQQIKTWYRWRVSPKARAASKKQTSAEEDFYTARSRSLKPYELYSTMYKENFEEELQAQLNIRGVDKKNSGLRLKVWREVAQKCFEEEDEETRQAVFAELKRRSDARSAAHEEHRGPQQYLEY